MNLSNRIYTRKVFFRILYMFNFAKSVLKKNIYTSLSDKVDNIVKSWLDKIDSSDFQKFDFSILLEIEKKTNTKSFSIDEYLSLFDTEKADLFQKLVEYVSNFFVINKRWEKIEYDYLIKNMSYVKEEYDNIILKLNEKFDTFKFLELNSIDQSILLLWITEFYTYKTPKAVIIKECSFLADTFWTDNSIWLINAILDKTLI